MYLGVLVLFGAFASGAPAEYPLSFALALLLSVQYPILEFYRGYST